MRLLIFLLLLALGGGGYWFATAPRGTDTAGLATLPQDAQAGELVFWAAGCASCHTTRTDQGETAENPLELGGGLALGSPFGTFRAPNISSHPEQGIGRWTLAQFADAVRAGVSPEGEHYFPAFPYAAYAGMTDADLAALWAFMQGLPPVDTPSRPHEVGFPFDIRRNIGAWKLMFARGSWAVAGDLDESATRGRYLAEALAHCGECHTPRNGLGGLVRDRWLAGAPNPAGQGRIPNITPAGLDWSTADIAAYLKTGFTPEYDTAGGQMAEVVENLARLPDADRQAIADYLKAVPAAE